MTTTEFGYCATCDDDVEVEDYGGRFSCPNCGGVDIYDSAHEFEIMDEYMMDTDPGVPGS